MRGSRWVGEGLDGGGEKSPGWVRGWGGALRRTGGLVLVSPPCGTGASGRAKGKAGWPPVAGVRVCAAPPGTPLRAYLRRPCGAQLLPPCPSCRQEDLALIKTGELRFLPGVRVVAAPWCPR